MTINDAEGMPITFVEAFGSPLLVCLVCHAVVLEKDSDKHAEWHGGHYSDGLSDCGER